MGSNDLKSAKDVASNELRRGPHEMNTPNSVSVLIDTYNHERFIETAIRSVLAQEDIGQVAIEIIVVDDGSTDGTRKAIEAFGDQVRYIYNTNCGQASAFNCGVPLC
jgi:glycosyltransferase involved in cell wall biosynthesis